MSFPPGKQAPSFGAAFDKAKSNFVAKKTKGKKKHKTKKEAAADRKSPFFTKRSDGKPT